MSSARSAARTADAAPIEIGDDVPTLAGVPGAALPHRKLVFSVVAIALLIFSIDQPVVATALHTIEVELHTGLEGAGWTITA